MVSYTSFAIVNAITNLLIRPLSNKLQGFDSKKEGLMLRQIEAKHKLDLEALRLSKEFDFNNQVRLQEISHRNRLEEAAAQISMQYDIWLRQQTNNTTWPLETPFGSPLLNVDINKGGQIPLTVFLTKAKKDTDFVSMQLESYVRDHLNNYFTQEYNRDGNHPIISRIGDWKDDKHLSSNIQTLWAALSGQPCLIINPMPTESNKNLNLIVTMWGLGAEIQNSPTSEMVVQWDYLHESRRALRNWTKAYVEINQKYGSEIDKKGAIANNVEAYKEELRWRERGATSYEIEQHIYKKYKPCAEFQDEVYHEMGRNMANVICCVAGMFADIYYLMEYGIYPIMPYSIGQYAMNTQLDWDIPSFAIDYYRKALNNLACTDYLQDNIPITYLQTAHVLCYDKIQSLEIFKEGVWLWANRKDCSISQKPKQIDECIALIQKSISYEDKMFCDVAKDTLEAIGESYAAEYLQKRVVVPSMPSHSFNTENKPPVVDNKYTKEIVSKEIVEITKCKNCGRTIEWGATYCTHCGKAIKTEKCRYCGKPTVKESKYCIYCGHAKV